MTNDMVTMDQVDALTRVSKAMVASGFFKDTKDVAQAFVKIQAGAELGLPPFASMSGINVIMGRPELGANAQAALIKNDPRYNYRVLELSDTICRIQFFEDGEECGVSEFTDKDAKRAGTKNMGKYPRNMLFARAISNGAKWFVPGIFGGIAVYAPGELSGNDEGEIIDITPEPVILVDSKVEYDVDSKTGELSSKVSDIIIEPLISDKQRRQLHAVGKDLYDEGWDEKRAEMTAAFGLKSSNEWTADQADRVISGMSAKLRDTLIVEAKNAALFETE